MSSARTINMGEFVGEIIEEKYNPLIKRREVTIKVVHIGKSTPSRGLVRLEVAKYYGVDVNNVYVKRIDTEYGIGVSEVHVHVYDSYERAMQFEPEYIIKRNETAIQTLQQQ